MRFYPPTIPPFEHEPTGDRFEIRELGDPWGHGVVARVPFAPGDVVFAFAGTIVPAPTLFTLQSAPSIHVHDPHFMGKVLHACDPNCTVDMIGQRFIARRPIAPGEPITMDYEQTEDVLFRAFDCQCAAAGCRGRIAGRLALPLPHLSWDAVDAS